MIKKLSKLIVNSIIAITMVISCVACGFNDITNNKDSSKTPETKFLKGEVELVKTYECTFTSDNDCESGLYQYSYFTDYKTPYLFYELDGKEAVLDKNANVLFDTSSLQGLTYIRDGYFLSGDYYSENFEMVNESGEIQNFEKYEKQFVYYDNNIIYYVDANKNAIAYDLKNKQQLWSTSLNGLPHKYAYNPGLLSNGYIKIRLDEKDYRVLNKDTGVIYQPEEGEYTYPTEQRVYIINDTTVNIYDYNNNKLGTFELENNDEYWTKFHAGLNTGGYIIEKIEKNLYRSTYIVYNKDSKELFTFKDDNTVLGSTLNTNQGNSIPVQIGSEKYDIIKADDKYDSSYIVFDDDTYLEVYQFIIVGDYILVNPDEDHYQVKVINVKTNEIKTLNEKIYLNENPLVDLVAYSPNFNYFICLTDGEFSYTVYDKNFNKLYETKNSLEVVNDDYFIEQESVKDSEGNFVNYNYYLVNIKTLDKKKLDVKGRKSFNTTGNIVTTVTDEDKKYTFLYKFV